MCCASAQNSITISDTVTSRGTGASFRSNDRTTVDDAVGDAVATVIVVIAVIVVVTDAIVVSAAAVIAINVVTAVAVADIVVATSNIKLTIITGNEIVVVVGGGGGGGGSGCDDYDVVTTHGLHRTYHREGAIVQYHL